MGFGYLVLGSLVWLNPVYSGFTEWLAYTLILTGTSKLAPYGRGFKLSNIIGIPGLILSFANFLLCGLDILGFYSYQGSAFYSVIMICLLISTFALRISLLCGIFEITSETGIDKLKARSVYCIALYSTLFIFDLLQTVRIIPATSTGFAIILFGYLIVGAVTFFLVFACLRMIVLEGDETDIDIPFQKEKKTGWWQKIKQMSESDDEGDGEGGKN